MGKLTNKQRREIHDAMHGGGSATKLAAKYDTSRTTIYRIRDERFQTEGVPSGAFNEAGITGLNRFGGSVQEDYERDWRTLDKLVPLVKEMMSHPIVGSIMFAIEMSLRGAEWIVVPASESQADRNAAEFLEGCMHDMSHTWDDHVAEAMSMIQYGFAPFEKVFKRRLGMDMDPASKFDDGRIGWRKFALRSQDTLAPGDEWIFDDNGGIRGLNQQAPPNWTKVPIPIEKMILYRTTMQKNNPQGRSALRATWMAWYYSKNFMEIEGIAGERLGHGLPVMYLGEGTQKGTGADTDYENAKEIVRDIRMDEQAGVVIPYPKMTENNEGRGVLLELLAPESRGIIDYEKIIMRYNQQIAQTLLAHFIFLGLTEFGTQSLVVRITDFFSEAVAGWLRAVANTLNKFAVPQLFRLNMFSGLSGLPEFEIGSVGQIDTEAIMAAVESAVTAGALEPDEGVERKIRQILGFPQRGSPEGGELLQDIAPEPKMPVVGQPGGRTRQPKPAGEIDAAPKGEDLSASHRLIMNRMADMIGIAVEEFGVQ